MLQPSHREDTILRILALHGRDDEPWCSPRIVGAIKNSLGWSFRRLYDKGCVMRRNVGKGEQLPAYQYRVSPQGWEYLKNHPAPPGPNPKSRALRERYA